MNPARAASFCIATSMLFSAGCGGGGSKTDPLPVVPAAASTPGVASASASATSTIVTTSAPPSAYASMSEEQAAFALLNDERSRCGFGRLAQSTQLDAAARAHADYQIRHDLDSHFENSTTYPTGYTGTTAAQRVAAQGYTDLGGVTDEYSYFLGTTAEAGKGTVAMRSLLNAPYHLAGLMSGYRDVGMAVRNTTEVGAGSAAVYLQINAAYKAAEGRQQLGGTDIATYPCDGTTGVNRRLSSEDPNPVPGRNLSTNPLGSAVYIGIREGQTLTIASASMTKVSNGAGVTLRTPTTSANDPNGPCSEGCLKSNQGFLLPDAPLEANTAYSVTINGANNGVSFSRTFTFTTGTGG